MKKLCSVVLVALLIFLCVSCGYSSESEYEPPPLPPTEDLDKRTDGIVIDTQDDPFVVTVFPTEIFMHDGHKKIHYAYSVVNGTVQEYKNFTAFLEINSKLDAYIASGVLSQPSNTFDMKSKELLGQDASDGSNDASGLNMHVVSGVADDESLAELGLSADECIKWAEDFSIRITWKGGEVTYLATAPVIDNT